MQMTITILLSTHERAILDGHILLSREQAQLGIYPAIDLQNSISRVMDDIVTEEHVQLE